MFKLVYGWQTSGIAYYSLQTVFVGPSKASTASATSATSSSLPDDDIQHRQQNNSSV